VDTSLNWPVVRGAHQSSRDMGYVGNFDEISGTQGRLSLGSPNMEAMVIDSLTLEEYHRICAWNLCQFRTTTFSFPVTVKLGTVVSCSPNNRLENCVEIAAVPNAEAFIGSWRILGEPAKGKKMEDGWTCQTMH